MMIAICLCHENVTCSGPLSFAKIDMSSQISKHVIEGVKVRVFWQSFFVKMPAIATVIESMSTMASLALETLGNETQIEKCQFLSHLPW